MDELKKILQSIDLPEIHAEMPHGHKDRFQERLYRFQKKRNSKVIALCMAGMAASLLLAFLMFDKEEGISHITDPELGDVSFEMEQMESYFIHRIEQSSIPEPGDDPILQLQIQGLSRLEEEYTHLRKALNQNFGNQRVIDAMIQNYKMRILILEQMKSQFNFNQQRSNFHNNDTSI